MEEIEKVHVTKCLGVYIDYRLDWKRHIHHIINKVSKSISIIYRASQKLTQTAWLVVQYIDFTIFIILFRSVG